MTEQDVAKGAPPRIRQILRLTLDRFKSYRNTQIEFSPLTVFIGANASGKSNLVDALRFLSMGATQRSFHELLRRFRGGFFHLAWKGRPASVISLAVTCRNPEGAHGVWNLRIEKSDRDLALVETVEAGAAGASPLPVLNVSRGKGEYHVGPRNARATVPVDSDPLVPALPTAADHPEFAARWLAQFIRAWGTYDPEPNRLRVGSPDVPAESLADTGENLVQRLQAWNAEDQAKWAQAVRDVLGWPQDLGRSARKPEEQAGGTGSGREETEAAPPFAPQPSVMLWAQEAGLSYRVWQPGFSSGTLRTMVILAALMDPQGSSIVVVEEPENYLHPRSLYNLAQCLKQASESRQIIVTTHSPLLLDYLGEPGAVRIVRREGSETRVGHPDGLQGHQIREILEKCGMGLGEYLQGTGFGA